MSQLAAELEKVYGCNAMSVFSVYVKHDPLKLKPNVDQYWEHTRRFLENLHSVLYAPDHKLSLNNITPESYYFLTKTCIDHAFSVTELINVRNDREKKYAKDMANDIAHYILPPYLTYRRQTLECKFTGSNGPNPISEQAKLLALPMPLPPMPFYPSMPMQMPMPFYPSMPMQLPMPFYPSMPMQMPIQPQFQPLQPLASQFQPLQPQPQPQPPQPKPKPIVKRKPVCTRIGKVRESTNQDLVMPEPEEMVDNVPLNFYNVYCSELANRINSAAEQHHVNVHVPQIFPVSNRPPPPV